LIFEHNYRRKHLQNLFHFSFHLTEKHWKQGTTTIMDITNVGAGWDHICIDMEELVMMLIAGTT
jgi:hypothetical protein